MVDSTLPADRSIDPVCPWCSTVVTPETAVCPSCAAILISDEERDLPGVTAVDPEVLRGEKKAPGRSRLLSWISGEYPDVEKPSDATSAALAPPEPEVQREILRLELEAEVANLQAEADALRSEARAEGRDFPAAAVTEAEADAMTDADADADAATGQPADAAQPAPVASADAPADGAPREPTPPA
jgi:hypothetical protein